MVPLDVLLARGPQQCLLLTSCEDVREQMLQSQWQQEVKGPCCYELGLV